MIVRRIIITSNLQLWRNICNTNHKCWFSNASREIVDEEDSKANTPESENQQKNDEQKLLRVAMIGVPNAGKSTLINALTEHRVCIYILYILSENLFFVNMYNFFIRFARYPEKYIRQEISHKRLPLKVIPK